MYKDDTYMYVCICMKMFRKTHHEVTWPWPQYAQTGVDGEHSSQNSSMIALTLGGDSSNIPHKWTGHKAATS